MEAISEKSLVDTVKQWVLVDNQMRALQKKLKELRNEKKKKNEDMISMMKLHEIDNFDLKDGQIQYKKATKKETLTPTRLLSILSTHPQLGVQQAHHLQEFILENRKSFEKEIIVRKMNQIPNSGI
jgi:hypothetical protein